jgi:hypothetical protein
MKPAGLRGLRALVTGATDTVAEAVRDRLGGIDGGTVPTVLR